MNLKLVCNTNKKNHFFSRIHVDDIANALFKSLKNFKKGEIYNISDDKPASNKEVIMYGIKLLGVNEPQTVEINEIESELLKNFYICRLYSFKETTP